MGQYWKVFNIDKLQTHRNWGKLGEFLFSNLPNLLVFDLLRESVEILPFQDNVDAWEDDSLPPRPLS
jgi:hypothetical protein